MTIFNLIKVIFQAVCNPSDFCDSAKCREIVRNALAFARTISEKNSVDWDEKVLDQFDKIVASDELWNYCFNLISGWFGSDPDQGIKIDTDTDSDGKPIFTPEGVAGLTTVIPILIQVWKLIRLFKTLTVEDKSNE